MALFLFVVLSFAVSPHAADIGGLDPGDLIFHFRGTDTSSIIGQAIGGVGDVNGDGITDFSFSSYSPTGTYIFFGGNPVDSFPDMFIKGQYGPPARVHLDGDGLDELITSEVHESYGGGRIGVLYFYKGYGDSIGACPYDSLFAVPDSSWTEPTNYGFGEQFVVGYVDADSLGDLVVVQPNNIGGPRLFFYRGATISDTVADWTYTFSNYSHFVWDIGLIDFDGDAHLDLFVALAQDKDTLGKVIIFRGPRFGEQPDFTIPDLVPFDTIGSNWFPVEASNVGDFNGDGWPDLGVIFKLKGFVYFCGPSADTLPDVAFEFYTQEIAGAGDMNADGFGDVLCGEGNGPDGIVDVYLGNNLRDGYPDDGIIRYYLPPLFLMNIGYRVAGPGDVNNDGFDDIMFAARNFAHGNPHDVFIFRGSADVVTDVEDSEEEGILPTNVTLHQNYPNPFNPSTTIPFDLPRASYVRLTVYNIAGQQVATLVDRQLRAGHYAVTWDGQDAGGRLVASGVYVYRLETDGITRTRKMIMVK